MSNKNMKGDNDKSVRDIKRFLKDVRKQYREKTDKALTNLFDNDSAIEDTSTLDDIVEWFGLDNRVCDVKSRHTVPLGTTKVKPPSDSQVLDYATWVARKAISSQDSITMDKVIRLASLGQLAVAKEYENRRLYLTHPKEIVNPANLRRKWNTKNESDMVMIEIANWRWTEGMAFMSYSERVLKSLQNQVNNQEADLIEKIYQFEDIKRIEAKLISEFKTFEKVSEELDLDILSEVLDVLGIKEGALASAVRIVRSRKMEEVAQDDLMLRITNSVNYNRRLTDD